jgi:hypothetical protein
MRCPPPSATCRSPACRAVIVDIDETMLDNSPYQARLVRDGKSFNDASWNDWVQARAARPLPGALEFAKAAAARGVTIYYLSNRTADQGPATDRQPAQGRLPIASEAQFLGLGTIVDGCEAEGSNKGCRRRLVGRTHRVLLQLGDQIGDFVDIVANNPPAASRPCAVPVLGRRALVRAAQPQLRQLGAGAVQQRVARAGSRAPRLQAGRAALLSAPMAKFFSRLLVGSLLATLLLLPACRRAAQAPGDPVAAVHGLAKALRDDDLVRYSQLSMPPELHKRMEQRWHDEAARGGAADPGAGEGLTRAGCSA